MEEVTHLMATRKNKRMGRTGSKYLSKGVLSMTQIPPRPLKTFRNLKTPTLSTVFHIATKDDKAFNTWTFRKHPIPKL